LLEEPQASPARPYSRSSIKTAMSKEEGVKLVTVAGRENLVSHLR